MPAAAVIPAPIAYIKVVAIKTLVVEPRMQLGGRLYWLHFSDCIFPSGKLLWYSFIATGHQDFYFEKIRVFKAGLRLNTLAWNNKIGLWFYFVGF